MPNAYGSHRKRRRFPARSGYCQRTGKVRFHDEKSANIALNDLVAHKEEMDEDRELPVRSYRCPYCGGWHWTSRE